MIGCGYVGLVTGTCLAEAGHQVVCTDNDPERIATLKAGVVPIYEPHLDALLASNCRAGNLSSSQVTLPTLYERLMPFSFAWALRRLRTVMPTFQPSIMWREW